MEGKRDLQAECGNGTYGSGCRVRFAQTEDSRDKKPTGCEPGLLGELCGTEKKKDKKKDDGPEEKLRGVYMFPNGDKYDGEYCRTEAGAIERSGSGTHTTSEGVVYEGQWAGDKMNGQGKLSHPSGSVYEGEFNNNQFHGEGKYMWPNGSFYEGQFVENKLEGEGNFTDTETQTWTGLFRYRAAPGLRFKQNMD